MPRKPPTPAPKKAAKPSPKLSSKPAEKPSGKPAGRRATRTAAPGRLRQDPSESPLQVARASRQPTGTQEYPTYYAVIRQIPRGRVLTYGDVARLALRPTSARRVGYALAALKDGAVPWWRVVNARGEVSPRSGDLLGACELDQRARLLAEGIQLDEDGRLSLSRYRWSPAAAALAGRGL